MPPAIRVAGTDPGTSSLDVLVLKDGAVGEQCRFTPEQLQTDPALPVRWLSRPPSLAACHCWKTLSRQARSRTRPASVAAMHRPPIRTSPSGEIVHRWLELCRQVASPIPLVSGLRHLRSALCQMCPASMAPCGMLTCQVNVTEPSGPLLSATLTTGWNVPGAESHPEIRPHGPIASPGGSPEALNLSVQPGSESEAATCTSPGLPATPA